MSKDTKNTKLWKLLAERDNNERCLVGTALSYLVKTKRNDKIDSEIDNLLRN